MRIRIAFLIVGPLIVALVATSCTSNNPPAPSSPANVAPDATRLAPTPPPALSRPMGGRSGG